MKLYGFELLFFDGTVIIGKFSVGMPLNIQTIYLTELVYFKVRRKFQYGLGFMLAWAL